MRRGFVAGSLGVAALVLAACGSSSSGGPARSIGTVKPSATANANGCTPPHALTKAPQVNAYPQEPPLTIAHTTYTARIVTNCGTIVVKLDGRHAPHTVNSFNFLAAKGFFTDTPCFRLTTSGIYVLQCGDPTGAGEYGPGYKVPDENLKGATYPAGTMAMANTGRPNTNDSEFFLVYADSTAGLSPSYTPVGQVTSGLGVLTRIAKAGAPNGDGPPVQPVVITSFTVTKG